MQHIQKNDIKDIEPTSKIIIDDVFKMEKEVIKKYKKEFKIENEAKEIIDDLIEVYTDTDTGEKSKMIRTIKDISDLLFYFSVLKITEKFPVFKNENLKEIMEQKII